MRIGFLFAGQGQQYQGMAGDLVTKYDVVSETFKQASNILGYDILDICLNNPDKALMQTVYTQPALLTLSQSIFRVLSENKIECECVAGLSLGEYNALVAAQIISFEDALAIIKERALLMDHALPKGSTKMAAVLKANLKKISEVLVDERLDNQVAICNYNTFDQIVIGGQVEKLDLAIDLLKEKGLKRVIKLDVSTVSHMHLLKPASKLLENVLHNYTFNKPTISFINNVAGTYQTRDFVTSLSEQIAKPTHMAETIELMLNDGIDTFIEIGPKNALSGFVKSMAKSLEKEVKILSVYDEATLDKTLREIGDENE